MENKALINEAQESDETNTDPPPTYVPESDVKPLLRAEQHPQPLGPSPFGTVQAQHQTVVVTSQPTATAIYAPAAPSWVGHDALIYLSIVTMICCGLLPGLVALMLSWEARNKRDLGLIEEAKSYTIGAIVCNVLVFLAGVGSIIGVGVYFGIRLSVYYY